MSHFVQHSHFTQLGDRFKITVYAQTSPCVIAVSGRLQGANGHRANFEHLVTVSATGLQTVYRPASGEWWIMSCVASVASGTVNPGDVLVKVELVQGDPTNTVPHDTLIVGSPDSFVPVTMGSPGEFSVDGRRPRIRTVANADPAVNDPQIYTVPSGVSWIIDTGLFALTTIPVTGACTAYLEIYRADADYLWVWRSNYPIGAGTTAFVVLQRQTGYYRDSTAPRELVSMPEITLFPTDTIYMTFIAATGNVQVLSTSLRVKETILGY